MKREGFVVWFGVFFLGELFLGFLVGGSGVALCFIFLIFLYGTSTAGSALHLLNHNTLCPEACPIQDLQDLFSYQ